MDESVAAIGIRPGILPGGFGLLPSRPLADFVDRRHSFFALCLDRRFRPLLFISAVWMAGTFSSGSTCDRT
jgi:hypothetical protein